MIEISIPGNETLQLRHLICDYNGTLALDGELIEGVGQAMGNTGPGFDRSCDHRRHIRNRGSTTGRCSVSDSRAFRPAIRIMENSTMYGNWGLSDVYVSETAEMTG